MRGRIVVCTHALCFRASGRITFARTWITLVLVQTMYPYRQRNAFRVASVCSSIITITRRGFI